MRFLACGVLGIVFSACGVFLVAQDELPVISRTISEQEMHALVSQVREEFKLPAVWAARYDLNGSSVVVADGIRKQGEEESARRGDLIHLGSCTKAMTALLVAQAITAGKLDWQTTLVKVLPEVKDSPWAKCTIEEMLWHHSGMPANAPWDRLHAATKDPVESRRGLVRWLIQQPMPNRKSYVYSNVGYSLLGHVVERLETTSWEELITQRLFNPLEISSVGFGPVAGPNPLDQPWGHTSPRTAVGAVSQALSTVFGNPVTGKWDPIQFDNPVPLGPAGRVHMKMDDWAKFVRLYATQDPPAHLNVSDQVWSRLLTAKPTGNYAGGWLLFDRTWAKASEKPKGGNPGADNLGTAGAGLALNHAGSNTTWYCVAWVAPERRFFVLVATNCFNSTAIRACDKIAEKLVTP